MPEASPNRYAETRCSRYLVGVNVCVWAMLSAALAFVWVQGRYIGIKNFFSPLHHDDLYALSSDPHFDFWLPRPISSNFIYMLGAHGAGIYYCIYFVLWICCIMLTQLLACRLFRIKVDALSAAVLTFLSACAWFSLGSSVMTMQYLGLSTNGLSYLFGVLAVLVLVSGRSSVARMAGVTLLVLLSAFAKEDMLAFLCAACLWRACEDRARGMPWRQIAAYFIVTVSLIIGSYGLSLWHSHVSGSPFTAGSGNYDLSSPLANIVKNAAGFYASTPATRAVILLCFVGIAVMVVRAFVVRTWIAMADVVAVMLPLSLALPYLALPRFVEYYVVTFIPLTIAMLPMIATTIVGSRRTGVAAWCALLLAAGFYWKDTDSRRVQLAWNAEARTVSRHQIEELDRASDAGLAQCQVVAVTGTSGYLGPFLSGGPGFVDKQIGASIAWRIATEPNTIVESFAKVTPIPNKRWMYVASAEQAKLGADCLMAFNAHGYARFERMQRESTNPSP